MKELAKIAFALLIVVLLLTNKTYAQSSAIAIDSFSSFINIKLGCNKNEIKYPLENHDAKDVFEVIKDTLGVYLNSKVKHCYLKFNGKDILTEITLVFSGFTYHPNIDTVQKRVDFLYNRIKNKAGEYTKLKKTENYFEYSWLGTQVKVTYTVELKSDGMGIFGGTSGSFFGRSIVLKQL